MTDDAEWGYAKDGVPKLGEFIGYLWLVVATVMIVVAAVVLCIPFEIWSWMRGDWSPYSFYDDNESD